MEGLQKNEAPKTETGVESVEVQESIEKAKELVEALKAYDEQDVVGQAETDKVETIAQALTMELQSIPPTVRMREGLPYHPMDEAFAVA